MYELHCPACHVDHHSVPGKRHAAFGDWLSQEERQHVVNYLRVQVLSAR